MPSWRKSRRLHAHTLTWETAPEPALRYCAVRISLMQKAHVIVEFFVKKLPAWPWHKKGPSPLAWLILPGRQSPIPQGTRGGGGVYSWQQRSYNTVKENRKCLQSQGQQRAKAEPELAPSLGWQGRPSTGRKAWRSSQAAPVLISLLQVRSWASTSQTSWNA